MKQILTPRNLFIASAVLLAGFTRLVEHPFNFTAIGAMALFGGAAFADKRLAIIVPMVTMFVTDYILGFHNTMLFVYPSFLIVTLIGIKISKEVNAGRVILGSLLSSILFFLVTNFGVWMNGGLYSNDFNGLLQCYVAGLAFYDHSFFGNLALNTVMGDLFFNAVLFGSLALASQRFPALAKIRA